MSFQNIVIRKGDKGVVKEARFASIVAFSSAARVRPTRPVVVSGEERGGIARLPKSSRRVLR